MFKILYLLIYMNKIAAMQLKNLLLVVVYEFLFYYFLNFSCLNIDRIYVRVPYTKLNYKYYLITGIPVQCLLFLDWGLLLFCCVQQLSYVADLHAPSPSTTIGPASSHVSVGTSTATIPVDVASLINPHTGWDWQQLAMYIWVCILPNHLNMSFTTCKFIRFKKNMKFRDILKTDIKEIK